MKFDNTLSNMIAIISAALVFCLGLMYKIYEDFIFNNATKIKGTFDIAKLLGEMRVGRFFIFLGLWALLIVFNMAIFSVAFSKRDFTNQAKITSILYVGIVATTFIVIGIVPGLVEIFENTFGTFIVSTAPTSWIYKFDKIIDVFQSRRFKQDDIQIPFTYLMPMFNLRDYDKLFDEISKLSIEIKKESKGVSGGMLSGPAPAEPAGPGPVQSVGDTLSTAVSNATTNLAGIGADEKMVDFDFYFDFNKVCRDATDNKTAASEMFKQELYKICLAKQNAGHFAWAYIASIVTILSTVAVM
jgi:hypothetical protein